jgi:Matrixin
MREFQPPGFGGPVGEPPIDEQPGAQRPVVPSSAVKRSRRWLTAEWRRLTWLIVVVLVSVGGPALHRTHRDPLPPPPQDMAAAPLGVAAVPPAGVGGYAFFATQRGGQQPVAWDPCRPVHYVVHGAGAPVDANVVLRSSFGQLSRATGLQFIDDGPTDERPNVHRAAVQERYGRRWAPVLLAWARPGDPAELGPDLLGETRAAIYDSGEAGGRRYVTGEAVFNASGVEHFLQTGRAGDAQAVILHEFGHLVGLGHVNDPYQVMYPSNELPLSYYRSGDLRGLAKLGTGRCFTDH